MNTNDKSERKQRKIALYIKGRREKEGRVYTKVLTNKRKGDKRVDQTSKERRKGKERTKKKWIERKEIRKCRIKRENKNKKC